MIGPANWIWYIYIHNIMIYRRLLIVRIELDWDNEFSNGNMPKHAKTLWNSLLVATWPGAPGKGHDLRESDRRGRCLVLRCSTRRFVAQPETDERWWKMMNACVQTCWAVLKLTKSAIDLIADRPRSGRWVSRSSQQEQRCQPLKCCLKIGCETTSACQPDLHA